MHPQWSILVKKDFMVDDNEGESLAGAGWLVVPAPQDLRQEDRKFKATWAME